MHTGERPAIAPLRALTTHARPRGPAMREPA
jgi:hypothetical protein